MAGSAGGHGRPPERVLRRSCTQGPAAAGPVEQNQGRLRPLSKARSGCVFREGSRLGRLVFRRRAAGRGVSARFVRMTVGVCAQAPGVEAEAAWTPPERGVRCAVRCLDCGSARRRSGGVLPPPLFCCGPGWVNCPRLLQTSVWSPHPAALPRRLGAGSSLPVERPVRGRAVHIGRCAASVFWGRSTPRRTTPLRRASCPPALGSHAKRPAARSAPWNAVGVRAGRRRSGGVLPPELLRWGPGWVNCPRLLQTSSWSPHPAALPTTPRRWVFAARGKTGQGSGFLYRPLRGLGVQGRFNAAPDHSAPAGVLPACARVSRDAAGCALCALERGRTARWAPTLRRRPAAGAPSLGPWLGELFTFVADVRLVAASCGSPTTPRRWVFAARGKTGQGSGFLYRPLRGLGLQGRVNAAPDHSAPAGVLPACARVSHDAAGFVLFGVGGASSARWTPTVSCAHTAVRARDGSAGGHGRPPERVLRRSCTQGLLQEPGRPRPKAAQRPL